MTTFGDFDAIAVGDSASIVKPIGEADLRRFVEMTGDDNPLHVDRSYAESTSFRDIVVHGMLGASFISTVIGTRLPGPGALWLSQNMEFLLPVRLNDVLTITCTVTRKNERERLLDLETRIENQHGQVVLAGQGRVKMLATDRPAQPVAPVRSQVAIVTGGAGGIGRAICVKLASCGFAVVVNYRTNREQAEALVAQLAKDGKRAMAVQADVASLEGALHLHREATRQFGGIGVLVNNASPPIAPKPFAQLEWSDVQLQLDGQLKAAFLMAKACVPDMVRAGAGRIVNITSQIVDGVQTAPWTAYAIGKGSLATFSRSLAAELGPSGITVNCVAPGMTQTRLIADVPEKAQLIVARQTPLRRLALPEDIAAAVAYLASADGDFVTGQTLRVNGGMTMT
ncbi:MAG: SDR family oxidoreductase [Burkholderiales bacterium]